MEHKTEKTKLLQNIREGELFPSHTFVICIHFYLLTLSYTAVRQVATKVSEIGNCEDLSL